MLAPCLLLAQLHSRPQSTENRMSPETVSLGYIFVVDCIRVSLIVLTQHRGVQNIPTQNQREKAVQGHLFRSYM